MRRIKLSTEAKAAMRILHSGNGCPSTYPKHKFALGVEELEERGFARCAWSSGHQLESAELTSKGEAYIVLNPSLRNPIDWRWIITTIISLIATVAALFIACSNH